MNNSLKSEKQLNDKAKCVWCCENNYACAQEDLKEPCDLRSLPKEKDAILQRILQEKEYIDGAKSTLSRGDEDEVRVIIDKVVGINIMINVLQRDFGMDRKDIIKATGEKDLSWMQRAKLYAHIRKMKLERGGR